MIQTKVLICFLAIHGRLQLVAITYEKLCLISGSGDTVPCEFNQCPNTIIEFNVICSDGLLEVQWSAPYDSNFGFCIQYQCSMDPHLEFCTSETKQVCMGNICIYNFITDIFAVGGV